MDHDSMDEKRLDTNNRRNYSDSCEEKYENNVDIESSEPSLDKKIFFKTSVDENCPSYQENCSTSSDEVGESSSSSLYAESQVCKSDAIRVHEKSEFESKALVTSSAFREQLGYSSDVSSSESSVADVNEEPQLWCSENNFCLHCSKNVFDLDINLPENSSKNSHVPDVPISFNKKQMGRHEISTEAISRYFRSLESSTGSTTANHQPAITFGEEEYKIKCASAPNIATPSSSRFSSNFHSYCSSRERQCLSDVNTVDAFDDFKDIKSSLNRIPQRETLGKNVSTANELSNESGRCIFCNLSRENNPVLTDVNAKLACPTASQIKSVWDKCLLLDHISLMRTSSQLPIGSASINKSETLLKDEEGMKPCQDIEPINKENNSEINLSEMQMNHHSNTEVTQNRTLKRSLSDSTIGAKKLKTLKTTSPAKSPVEPLKTAVVHAAKRPASSDPSSSPVIAKKSKGENSVE